MKKLVPKDSQNDYDSFMTECLRSAECTEDFIRSASMKINNLAIEFYDRIGELFMMLGLHAAVAREGDVNCRFDAIIIDPECSIPIEIKSPREDPEINIKAVRQALENKIVLLSRKFYNTRPECTSLAIALNYPPHRSDVYGLINDIKSAFGFNIGIINVADILYLTYQSKVNGKRIDFRYLFTLFGKFDREKAFHKEPGL